MSRFGKYLFLAAFFQILTIGFPVCAQKKDKESKKKLTGQKTESDDFIIRLLEKYPQYFNSIVKNKEDWKIQVIYTQINRDKKGNPSLSDYYLGTDTANYFYPASTVKLPIAILALQKLNELKITGLDKNTTMITEKDSDEQTQVCNDPTTADGRPTIAHYIKKILLVSDNDAFNRLYEFLGQEYINNTLHKMGYADIQIIHRLQISLSEEQNRQTNPVEFYDTTGRLIYKKPPEKSKLEYAIRNTKMGKGYMRGDSLVNNPFDFSRKNRMALQDLHHIVRSIIFPESAPKKQRFNLTKDDYAFLRKYMSMLPGESDFPPYPVNEYWNAYVKFLYYGSEKTKIEPGIRIFNKVGDAYGFLIDAAYFADFENHVEFFLSAVIYCNSDGIFNDDKYDYDSIGFPFMKNLGRVIYEYEVKRYRKKMPNLSAFQFQYAN